MAGRSRLQRWLVGLLAPLALIGLGWWLLGDTLVVAAANRSLPLRIDDSLVITHAFASPPSTPAALVLELSPTQARTLARSAAGRAIPATVLRPGMGLDARWNWLDAGESFTLRAQLVAASAPPLARVALSAALVNAMLERHHRRQQSGGSVSWGYRLDPGSVIADDGAPVAVGDGWRRRFRATASGEVEAALGGDRCLVRVSYVEATLDLDLLADGEGWRLRGDVAVGRCESTIVECHSAILRFAAGGLPRLLETLLDQALSEEQLAGVRLPGWFPHDLRLAGRLE